MIIATRGGGIFLSDKIGVIDLESRSHNGISAAAAAKWGYWETVEPGEELDAAVAYEAEIAARGADLMGREPEQPARCGEMFVLAGGGKRTDAALHEPILAEGSDPASSHDFSRALGRKTGLSRDMIRRLWG